MLKSGQRMLGGYAFLAHEFQERSRWKIKPKLHQLAHVILRLQTSACNPVLWGGCWQGEDQVGQALVPALKSVSA
jgi:hypothetical protein